MSYTKSTPKPEPCRIIGDRRKENLDVYVFSSGQMAKYRCLVLNWVAGEDCKACSDLHRLYWTRCFDS
jgi:hypothetical protein